MAESGLMWFQDSLNRTAQKFSNAAGDITDNVADITSDAVDKGQDTMRQIVQAGGINKTKKGGPRILTGDMIDSIGGKVEINGRGRVQGEFGFIDGEPFYTIFQERGRKDGSLSSMLAFATAQQQVIEEMQASFEQGKWLPASLI